MDYKMEVVGTKTVGKKLKERTIKITNPEGDIALEDIKPIVENFEKNAKDKYKNHKLMVRAQNIQQFFTLKGYDDNNINIIEDIEDYYQGRVEDAGKFGKFFQLFLTIVY